MLEEFINHKTDILNVIADINRLLKENNLAGNERLLAVREQLISNHFNLVVLGQFKRGKTTLINSLVGNAILPSSVVPLTSIVTILKFGNEVRCTIFSQLQKVLRLHLLSNQYPPLSHYLFYMMLLENFLSSLELMI